ncbi:MAG: BtrH N-terminal domain-containing protein [Bacteroidales bacterium]|nr:BtrH N-terminal domain-containing protein [Bacteroidales bacterium]
MTTIPYNHKMGAHCESGTVTSLLNHAGLAISEPMVFGIASGIFFGYFHKHKSFTFPTFIVRNRPGDIRKNIKKRLGVKFQTYSFRNEEDGMNKLDDLLRQGIPVACQVDFFYMDYVPSWERAHVNVHFMVVIGKEGSDYLVSDSYFPRPERLNEQSLRRGRFAGGNMSPEGFLFYPTFVPADIDLRKPILKGIDKACFNMLKLPVPFIGINGIRLFAKRVVEWPKFARDTEHLSHEVMKINILLEDQGTGGAGFRFMYATFLQQASEILANSELKNLSSELMTIGDGWREISLFAARIGKNRDLGADKMKELSNLIAERAELEEDFFKKLKKSIK